MKKVILLTGNGFNYLINDIINSIPSTSVPKTLINPTSTITTRIADITVLWKKFDSLFSDLKKKSGGKLNEEELIKMIHAVLDLFSSISGLSKILSAKQLSDIQSIFDILILKEIHDICNEFKLYHTDGIYKDIKALFPEFGQKLYDQTLNPKCENFNVYSTNYDGVLDTLLTLHPRGFIFNDCFATPQPNNLLGLSSTYFSNKYIFAHLHGSYLYQRYFGVTFKQKSKAVNNSPVMVFNNPDLKKKIILSDNVLSEYYNNLANNLKTYDKLIILGNSMITEPHIKELIKIHFDTRSAHTEIVVCSPTPSDITAQIRSHFSGTITEISTSGIKTEHDLLDLIDQACK